MNRISRGRVGLLASSSLVASTLMAGLGGLTLTAFTPAAALAADVFCSPDASGGLDPTIGSSVEICDGSGTGITYTGGAVASTVMLGTASTGVTATTTGVNINTASAGSASITLTDVAKSSLTGTATTGLTLTTGTGNATIDFTHGTTVTGQDVGIAVTTTGAGAISVTTNGAVSGNLDAGVSADSASGDITINTAATTVSSTAADGIDAESTAGGNVTIHSGAVSAPSLQGIFAVGSNNIVVTTAGDVTGGPGAVGIVTESNATGNVTVTTGGAVSDGIAVVTAAADKGLATVNINGNVGIFGVNVVENGAFAEGVASANVSLQSGDISTVPGFRALVIDETGTIHLTTAAGTDISSGSGAGIFIQGGGGDITGSIAGTVEGDAAVKMTNTLTGNITIPYSGNITGTDGAIEQSTVDGADTAILLGTSGNHSVFDGGAGSSPSIMVTASGNGAVTVATTSSTDIETTGSLVADGIVARSGSGPVTVSLNGTIGAAAAVGGVGISSVTNGAGSNTVNLNGNINSGAGGAAGGGVIAQSNGTGSVTINISKAVTPAGAGNQTQNAVTVVTSGGSGILAENNDATNAANTSAEVTMAAGAPGPLTVTVNGALAGDVGVGARTNGGSATVTGSLASVDLSNAPSGSLISIEGANQIAGISAVADDTGSDAGSAVVKTGANLTVSVGAAGGNFDFGVLALTQDGSDPGLSASITLGDGDTITVGNVSNSTNAIGVSANGTGSSGSGGDPVSITAGNLETITASGGGAIGVQALVGAGFAFGNPNSINVTIGNGGTINVHDTAGLIGTGVLANDSGTGAGATVNVAIGTTAVNVDHGDGVLAFANGSNSATVSSLGNITAGGRGMVVATALGDASNNYNSTGNGSATMNFGGSVGVGATASGGNGNATVTLGNGVGQTVIHSTNNATASTGVLAQATGTGTASIKSNGNVTVDPTQFAQQATSGLGQAIITTGLNDSNSVADPGFVTPEHIGLFAQTGATADPAAGPSADIIVAGNNTVSVETTQGSAFDLGIGAFNTGNGVGSAFVSTGGNLTLSVGGENAAGILATTVGTNGGASLNAATGAGNVTIDVGSGQIVVGPAGATATTPSAGTEFAAAYGEIATTDGGNVNIANNANIRVENVAGDFGVAGFGTNTVGILASTKGAGAIDIGAATGGSLIQTQVGAGILASHTGGGSGSVTVGGGANGLVQENITTGVANSSGFAAGNGIEATTNGSGTVSVRQGNLSTITTLGTALGNNGTANVGILATNTAGAKFFGDVDVTVGGNISTAQAVGAVAGTFGGTASVGLGGQGVVAETNGNGNIMVNELATGNISSAADGIDAVNSSGANGNISLTVSGQLTAAGANGVAAFTTTNDDVLITVSGGNIQTPGGAGASAVDFDGGEGTITIQTTGNSVVSSRADALVAQTNGAGVIIVDNGVAGSGAGGVLASTTLDGILAENLSNANSGDVFVDNEGNITNAGFDGIHALVENSTNDASVHVVTGSIQSTGLGVNATTAGAGEVDVTINATTNGAATLLNTTGDGVDAETFSGLKTSSVTVDVKGNVTSGANGVVAIGVGSSSVSVTGAANITGVSNGIQTETHNGTSTVDLTAGTTSATGDGAGVNAESDGAGKVQVTVASGATAIGGTGGNFNDGVLATANGSGTVDVLLQGNASTLSAPAKGFGVEALGSGGAVTVTETATGTVLDGGIFTHNSGSGAATVSVSGNTNSTGPWGIVASTEAGSATVTLHGNATVTANSGTGQNGVEVDTTTGPAVVTDTSPNTLITASLNGISANANDAGGTVNITYDGVINATGNLGAGIAGRAQSGQVTIQTGIGNITGASGITSSITAGAAQTHINTGSGTLTATTADGIHAVTGGSGAITIDTTGAIKAAENGIFAQGTDGAITVTNEGAIVGTSGNGIDMTTGGNATLQVNVHAPISDAVGIITAQTGSGTTNIVTNSAANTVTGTVGDGIQAVNGTGNGTINVGLGTGSRFLGAISGNAGGIDLSGAGAINVFTQGPVTGKNGWAISGNSTGGPITIDVTGGNITGADGGALGGGIFAETVGANDIHITNTTSVIGTGFASIGIEGIVNSGAGNVTIASTGPFVTGGGVALVGAAHSGTVTIGTAGAPITSVLGDGNTTGLAIEAVSTSGLVQIFTAKSASMAGDVNADAGILAESSTGQININNAAQIGAAGSGNGVASAGMLVEETTGSSSTGISVTNSGDIFVDGAENKLGGIITETGADENGSGPNAGIDVVNTGNITVAASANTTYGIYGSNAGNATVTLTNSGIIDPPTYGMFGTGNGSVNVSTSGSVTGTIAGLHGDSNGGATFTVNVSATGNAAVTGQTGNGIEAFTPEGANIVVDTTAAGNVSGGTNGIETQVTGSTGNLGTTSITTNDTVAGAAGWGISAQSFGGGNVTVVAGPGGAVTGTGSGGILAETTNTSSVTITGNTSIIGIGADTDGIAGFALGNGAVTVASTGPLVTGANDAIFASSNGGPVQVGSVVQAITGQIGDATTTNAAIEADNSNGTISVVNHGDMSHDGNADFGILAQSGSAGSGTISVTNTGAIGSAGSGNGVNDAGILAIEGNPGAVGLITVNNTGNVFADTNGTVVVSLGHGFTASGTVGVGAVSLGGADISLTNSGVITQPAYGILATTGGNIDVGNSGNISATAAGIDAISFGGGNVLVSNTASTVNVTGGDGIDAGSFLGNGSVTVTQGAGSILASNNGVQVLDDGGPISITSKGTETGTAGDGISATSIGGGSINVDTSLGGSVQGGINGIITSTGGSGATAINTLANGGLLTATNVTGAGGDGISAASTGSGGITITAGNTFGMGAAGDVSTGIAAVSTGGGNVSVTTRGNIEGDLTGNAGGTGAVGILATTSGGNGSVVVEVNQVVTSVPSIASSVVAGGDDGIFASSTGTGETLVVTESLGASGEIDATGATSVDGNLGPVGIFASGGTGGGNLGAAESVVVQPSAPVFALNGRAIVTVADNNALISVFDEAVGLGTSTTALGGNLTGNISYAVIDATTVSGATTTIQNSGLVGSVNAVFGGNNTVQVAGLSDLAVRGTTGSVEVDNQPGATLLGRVNFAGLTGTSTSVVNNDATWRTNGTSTFSPTGNATVGNSGLIVTATDQVRTTFAFGTATNTINNGGTIVVGEDLDSTGTAAAPAVTQITGTTTFANNGTIILGSANNLNSDRLINSVLSGTGTTLGGTGQIDLDANLWSDTQSAAACEAFVLTAADCVVIGHSTGNNGIQVLDTKAHALGAYNPVGITIVVGSSAANTFHLASTSDYFDGNPADAFLYGGHTNVLDKPGMFFYDLAYAPSDSTERLIGVPKATAFEFPTVEGAADSVWYTTTQTWFDRTTDLRDSLQGRADGTEPGVWLKAVGDWTHRNQSSSFSDPVVGYTAVFNTSYDQDTAGLLGGVDLLNVTGKNTAWVLGVETGTVQSDLRFTASPDTFGITATDLGGYATYLNGGLFVDGTFNANFLRLNANLPSEVMLPGGGLSGPPATNNIHGTSWGGQVEAGYNMPLGAMAFWEPVGSLSYVDTSFDQLPVLGGTDAMGHDQSFRGSLGLRLGVNQDFQYYKIKLAVTGRVWDEFDNDPTATLIVPGGVDFTSNDDLKGVFGEVSGQANLFSTTSGLSAFLTGGVKFKSNYDEGTVTLGARYQF